MGEPGFLVYVVMFLWIPAVLGIFVLLPPRRAVLASFLGAWMFLPVASMQIGGLPDYTKVSATCAGVLLATFLFDAPRITRFRPSLLDVPMLLFCLCPFASSVTNGLGAYDGVSESLREVIRWGMPYFIGRLYFSDREGAKELAYAVFLGGVLYIPFCLFEIRFSPQLHRWIYGYHQHSFLQTIRYGGYRPMVFMDHGLMVGMWMAAAAAIGTWLLVCGTLTPLLKRTFPWLFSNPRSDPPWRGSTQHMMTNIGPTAIVGLLLGVTVLVKSTGALLLLVAAVGALVAAGKFRICLPVLFLFLVPPGYALLRTAGGWTGKNLVRAVAQVRPDRAQSLEFRLDNEDMLTRKALQRPVFGWGGWGRSRVYDETGQDISVTDGLWVILLGTRGMVGLLLFLFTFLLPLPLFWRRFPMRRWSEREVAAVAAMSVWLVIYVVDCFPNAMANPIFVLMLGGLMGMAVAGFPGFDTAAAHADAGSGPRPAPPPTTRVTAS